MSSFTFTMNEVREVDPNEMFGLDAYPIHDPLHRAVLNQKIIDHFWNRESAFETLSQFRSKLRTFMNIQMPYFNQLYKSELLSIDPLVSQRIETLRENEATIGTKSNENTTGDTSTQGRSAATAMDMPQSELSEYGDYASGANHTIQDSKVNQTGEGSSNSDTETESKSKDISTGYTQSQAELLMLYRTSFLNIDADIVALIESENLFMKIWGTSEEYSRRENDYGIHRLSAYRWL